MPQNPFDKASRFAAKIDPASFLAWATGLPAGRLAFQSWLDARRVPFPNGADRTGDTVARVVNPTVIEAPWAIAIEFQIEPDPLMFGRLLVYLGQLWQEFKPDPERGSRFSVGAVVVNLTGSGTASHDLRWLDAGFATQLAVVERNLASENADDLLAGIEAGRWSRAVLPWLPLMTGGEDGGIIERWKKCAEEEPDSRRKANYAGLALIFAGAAKRKAIWEKALEGLNVIESEVVNEWIAQGKAMGLAEAKAMDLAEGKAKGLVEGTVLVLITVLEARFGLIPQETETAIQASTDLAALRSAAIQAVKAATLNEFRTATGL